MTVKLNELLKENPSHYMVDKYRNHIKNMERDLCLTPASYASWVKTQLSIRTKGNDRQEGRQPTRFSSGRQTTCPAEILQTIAD